MPSIKISQLANLTGISSDDFIPLVDSGSLTTYRVSIETWNALWDTYGSASHADTATLAITANTASWAITSSFAITASWAATSSYIDGTNVQGTVPTASWAITSSYALSSSASENAISASWALSSSYSFSGSFAGESISSSYAVTSSHSITASYALVVPVSSVGGIGSTSRGVTISGSLDAFSEKLAGYVRFEEMMLFDTSNNGVRLAVSPWSPYEITASWNDKAGAGGTDDAYAMDQNAWYDMWVIYNSGTTDVSLIMVNQGGGAYPRTNAPVWPAANGYDYQNYAGSLLITGSGSGSMDVIEYDSSGRKYKSAWVPFPDGAGYGVGGGVTFHHSCSAIPKRVEHFYRCGSPDAQYGIGDIITGENVRYHRRDDDWDYFCQAGQVYVSGSKNMVLYPCLPGNKGSFFRRITLKFSGYDTSWTPSRWSASVVASF